MSKIITHEKVLYLTFERPISAVLRVNEVWKKKALLLDSVYHVIDVYSDNERQGQGGALKCNGWQYKTMTAHTVLCWRGCFKTPVRSHLSTKQYKNHSQVSKINGLLNNYYKKSQLSKIESRWPTSSSYFLKENNICVYGYQDLNSNLAKFIEHLLCAVGCARYWSL